MVLNITLIGALDYLGFPADYAVGDFNNDGLLDVLFTGGSWDPEGRQAADRDNPIIYLMAQGGGSFSLETRPDLGASVGAVDADVADFNGDGIDDALIYDQGLDRDPFPGGPNTLLFGSDAGPVTTTTMPTFSDVTHGGAVGDIDNDGDIDIFVLNVIGPDDNPETGEPGSYLLLNDGAGNFTFNQTGLAGNLPEPPWWSTTGRGRLPFNEDYIYDVVNDPSFLSAAFGDMNNDGNLDLIVGASASSHSFVAFGDGTGNFDMANATNLPDSGFGRISSDDVFGSYGGFTVELLVTDINGDGIDDLLTSTAAYPDYDGLYIQILINDGQGNFTDESAERFIDDDYNSPELQYVFEITEIDFNDDKFTDYLLNVIFIQNSAAFYEGELELQPMVLLNDGTGHFNTLTAGDLGLPSIALVAVDGGYLTFDNTTLNDVLPSDGISNVYFVEGDYSTGPGGIDPADFGAPGFNEFYYLNNNADVLAGVNDGSIESGLSHYLSTGQAEGRVGFVVAITVRGQDGVLDNIVYSVNRDAYTVTESSSVFTVTNASTGETLDTLSSIERIEYSDGTLALDTAGSAGQTYRLYQAAFARTPDTPGLSHNVNLLDGDLVLHDLSNGFILSAEFIALYGADSSNETFLTALYQNVLGRGPDPVGFNSWNNFLESGELDRADVLIGFSESPENIALVGTAIEDGIWLG